MNRIIENPDYPMKHVDMGATGMNKKVVNDFTRNV
jgi:hypothetical protein